MNEALELRSRLRAACCDDHALGSKRALLQHLDRVARVVETARKSKGEAVAFPALASPQEVQS